MKNQVIKYVAGPPGIGKTTQAAKWVVARMLKRKGPTIYVAPTKNLLDQFFNDVSVHWQLAGRSRGELLQLIADCYRQQGLRQSVERMVKSFYVPDAFNTNYVRPYDDGALILMTHEGFFSLKSSTIPKNLMKKTAVYFDEAKKMVFDRSRLSLVLSKEQAKMFRGNFKLRSFGETGYYRIKLSRNFDQTTVDAVTKSIKNRGKTKALKELVEDIRSLRNEVYVSSKTFDKDSKFYGITLPSKVFHGFGDVTLMSAYFEASQMYHLLKNSKGIKLKDITESVDPCGIRREAVSERYKKTTIMPLTTRNKMLSLSQLRSALIPREDLKRLRDYVKAQRICSKNVSEAIRVFHQGRGTHDKLPPSVLNIVDFLDKSETVRSPIRWYLDKAARVMKRWAKKERDPRSPLVFVNKDYANFVDTGKYTLLSTSSHGLNTYQKSNVAVFLAAINPEIQMVNFMRARVGTDYDYQKDYAVDVCLQCISRTSVRDTESDKNVLIIVPDLRLAKYVHEGMYSHPVISLKASKKYGEMDVLSPSGIREVLVAKAQTPSEYYREYNKNPINKELNTLRQRLYRYRKSHRAGEDKTLEIEETLELIDALKAKKGT